MLEQVSTGLFKSQSLNEILDFTLSHAMEQFGSGLGVIVRYEDGPGRISHYINQGYSSRLFRNIEQLTLREINMLGGDRGKSIFLHRFFPGASKRIEALHRLLTEQRLNHGMSLLFTARTKIMGILHLWNHDDLEISETMRNEYAVMGRMIGLALENQHLQHDSCLDWKDSEKQLFALNSIINSISYTPDLKQVLSQALEQTLEVLDLKAGAIYLINEQQHLAKLVTSSGLPLDYIKHFEHLNLDSPPVSTVMHAGHSLITVELAYQSFETIQLQHQLGIKRVVSVPIRSRNRILGFICLTVAKFHSFESQEIYLLDAISKQLGVMVENLEITQPMNCPDNAAMLFPA